MEILCRKKEIEVLNKVCQSKEAEFLAIYGRRRVGKTYLIRKYFFSKKVKYFEIIGEKDAPLSEQLENFAVSFGKTFLSGISIKRPKNWKEAFELVYKQIKILPRNQKFVFFIDELPWLAGKKSRALQALDYYWNRYWSNMNNVILVVCGSAASWMLEHVINAKGGLHNRLTKIILLKPFNLKGVKLFLEHRDIYLSEKQVLDLYMVFGGIPYYLNQIEKGKSAAQNVNKICFSEEGLLFSEFDRLFRSLFDHAELHKLLIRAISSKRYGISREELIHLTKLTSGGTLNKRLNELQSAGFIQSFIPYGRKKKEYYYKVIDEYCYFYLQWVEPLRNRGIEAGKSYWQTKSKTPQAMAWAGYAFENICFKHVNHIQDALELNAVSCEIGNFRFLPKQGEKDTGAQIDLLFDRDDGIVTLCEIKYCEKKYSIDKSYARKLLNKMEVFEKNCRSDKQIFFALISVIGLKPTIWSEDMIQNEVTLQDLFSY